MLHSVRRTVALVAALFTLGLMSFQLAPANAAVPAVVPAYAVTGDDGPVDDPLVAAAAMDRGLAYVVNDGTVTIAVCRQFSTATTCSWNYDGGGANAHRYLAPGHSSQEFGWNDTDGFFCGAPYRVTIDKQAGGPTYTCTGSGLPPSGNARLFKTSGSLSGHLNRHVYVVK